MDNTEDSVNVLKFAESRATEILTLMQKVSTKDPKQLKQKLPYHMRRRAASHNPKRLPRSLRNKVAEETPAKKKKKRKVHKTLLEEYNKRQADSIWLPTHIWFAKRFHMKKMWGYHLPFQATGKRFRSSYRATVGKVLVQDLSYYSCIELRGKRENLLSCLSSLTDDSLGLDFAAESYADGSREGHCFLYHPNSFPYRAIGPVSFIWKPCVTKEDVSSINQQLWIWCHPTIHEELVEVLINIFNLKETAKSNDTESKQYKFASKTNYMKTKLHFQKELVYASNDVKMVLLKNTLVRHRLIGPKALSVLSSVLNIRNPDEMLHDKRLNGEDAGENEKMDVEGNTEKNRDVSAHTLVKQKVWNYLTHVKSSYSVPLKAVIGLTVDDPRLYVSTKNPDHLNDGEDVFVEEVPNILGEFSSPAVATSLLWNEDVRNEVTASQVPEHVINSERAKYIIPTASELRKCTSSVPVIVINQPGVNGYGSGWDLIAPLGWGMAFWIPFIYHGAQPAGLDDFCCINLESGCPSFPYSFPDTKAGASCEENIREENLKKFYKYSRAKRPNLNVLGVSAPFFMPWNILISDWQKEFQKEHSTSKTLDFKHMFASISENNDETAIFTIRSFKQISFLNHLCLSLQNKHDSNELLHTKNTLVQVLMTPKNIYLKSIILVRIKCLFRGIPSRFSGIYLPSDLDVENLKKNPKHFGPTEQQHIEYPDMPPRKKRKLLKEQARQQMKKLDRPDITSIVSSCDRKIIGYVSEGGFCRLSGHGYGVGHCSLTGFLTAFELCLKSKISFIVLVREQHTFQYRFASIQIIENPL